MIPIRTEGEKKSTCPFFFPTFAAVALKVQHSSDDIEVSVSLNFFHQFVNEGALKLDYSSTRSAHQVVVFSGTLNLIVTVCLVQVSLLHQAQFLEQAETPVDCGKANPGVLLNGLLV